ncbi:hypothetical protein G6F57_007543 [Rhizopus arrhizus]|uniref:Uncharacterized protein n=1 Tax=Rhizopus oryzae TaxID=64495 RepID=A0A9P6XDX0_RHIOR|nr:hypothetical protein G6F21_006870 [Rhizopus arrhizus]KAG1421578.1 hypothetical protein G6F58_003695 [Rhizopus delemar]KAG0799913.1 hypothetical protein G6F22_002757 [Rhizopus arrhizus]KAG0810841.1 hypothetical protein G6F20_007639 [Rhizopus arrhizus]KAG0840688.1 hypothetical protein G6F19_001920 [Rhizopus arrhizus]
MNDLLENLIKEAEVALCTRMNNPRKKKRKHKPVNDVKIKCMKGQQQLDTTLKEAMQITEKMGLSAKEHTPSLPFMMHYYAISAVKRIKRLFAVTRKLNRSTQLQMMLWATCFVMYTFNLYRCTFWTKGGYRILWKQRPRHTILFGSTGAHLPLFHLL